MPTNEHPTKIYGKTWILWAFTIIIGKASCFGCIIVRRKTAAPMVMRAVAFGKNICAPTAV